MGGTERLLLGLLPYLRAQGVDAHMLVLASDDADRFVAPLRAAGVPTEAIPMKRDITTHAVRGIARSIRRLSPDILHTHLFHADVYGQLAARRTGTPSVATMHSVMSFFSRQPYRSLAAAAHGNAFATIAISHHVAKYLCATGISNAAKIDVIWPGIDTEAWQARLDDRARARSKFGIPNDCFVVGMTGRMTVGKGHEVLLDAFEEIAHDQRVHLVLAGTGENFENVTARAQRSAFTERIHLLGYCDDIRDAFAAFDVSVVPTTPDLDEGFGLVAVEAMALCLPVVASDLGAISEVVADGVTGTLVPPGDSRALAESLRELRESQRLREEMGAAGRERAASQFSVASMAAKTMDVYARCP